MTRSREQQCVAMGAALAALPPARLKVVMSSVVLLDATEPELPVLLGHLDEVSQTLRELLRSAAGGVYERNADPYVWW
jgi:hypothetical protein